MIRVLVVEDSPTARALLVLLLDKDPEIRVVGQASNGRQAVRMAKELQPDLITMDVVMPDMSGVEATREIMSQNPIPILFVTAHSDTPELNLAFDALKAGALDLINKPRGFEEGNEDEWGSELLSKIKTLAKIRLKPTEDI